MFFSQNALGHLLQNGWLLGGGGAGVVFLEGWEAARRNPAAEYYPCHTLERVVDKNAIYQEMKDDFKKLHLQPKTSTKIIGLVDAIVKSNPPPIEKIQVCPEKISLLLPEIEVSKNGIALARQKTNSDKTDFMLNNIGIPLYANVETDLSYTEQETAYGISYEDQVSGIVFNDLANAGLETVSLSWNRYFTFIASRSFAISPKLRIGGSLQANSLHYNDVIAVLEDISATKRISTIKDLHPAYGVGMDLGAYYESNKFEGFRAALILRQFGDTTFSTRPLGKTRVYKSFQSLDSSVGYQIPHFLGLKLRLMVDYNDLLSRSESDPLKKIHLGSSADWYKLRVLIGLNQGDPTYGIGYVGEVFEGVFGMYGEELGKKIGLTTDWRYFFQTRYNF